MALPPGVLAECAKLTQAYWLVCPPVLPDRGLMTAPPMTLRAGALLASQVVTTEAQA